MPIKAEILDNLVVRDAKNFMTTADFEKLLHSNDDSVHEKEVILSEQLKRLSKEKTQLEKELHKLFAGGSPCTPLKRWARPKD